jgi:hypothetical protein
MLQVVPRKEDYVSPNHADDFLSLDMLSKLESLESFARKSVLEENFAGVNDNSMNILNEKSNPQLSLIAPEFSEADLMLLDLLEEDAKIKNSQSANSLIPQDTCHTTEVIIPRRLIALSVVSRYDKVGLREKVVLACDPGKILMHPLLVLNFVCRLPARY